MFRTLMGRTREHLVAEPQLLESLKALELGRVDDLPVDRFKIEDAMDRVVD